MKIDTLTNTVQSFSGTDPGETQARRQQVLNNDPRSPAVNMDPKDAASREKLTKLAQAVEDVLQVMGTELKFRIDEKTDAVQVEVIDPQKDKVLQKIPPDDLLKLAASIEDMVGVFVDKAF